MNYSLSLILVTFLFWLFRCYSFQAPTAILPCMAIVTPSKQKEKCLDTKVTICCHRIPTAKVGTVEETNLVQGLFIAIQVVVSPKVL